MNMQVTAQIQVSSIDELKEQLPEIATLKDTYNADITIYLAPSFSIETDKLNCE